MKTGVSRKKARIAILILALVVILILAGVIAKKAVILMIGAIVLLADYVLILSTTRCPNCGEYFYGLHWSSKKDAGVCKKCGEPLLYDDQIDEN